MFHIRGRNVYYHLSREEKSEGFVIGIRRKHRHGINYWLTRPLASRKMQLKEVRLVQGRRKTKGTLVSYLKQRTFSLSRSGGGERPLDGARVESAAARAKRLLPRSCLLCFETISILKELDKSILLALVASISFFTVVSSGIHTSLGLFTFTSPHVVYRNLN